MTSDDTTGGDATQPVYPIENHITKTGDLLAGDIENVMRGTSKFLGMTRGMGPDQWDDERLQEDWAEATECLQRAVFQMKAARQALLKHGGRDAEG